jgi:hypothetical protein
MPTLTVTVVAPGTLYRTVDANGNTVLVPSQTGHMYYSIDDGSGPQDYGSAPLTENSSGGSSDELGSAGPR